MSSSLSRYHSQAPDSASISARSSACRVKRAFGAVAAVAESRAHGPPLERRWSRVFPTDGLRSTESLSALSPVAKTPPSAAVIRSLRETSQQMLQLSRLQTVLPATRPRRQAQCARGMSTSTAGVGPLGMGGACSAGARSDVAQTHGRRNAIAARRAAPGPRAARLRRSAVPGSPPLEPGTPALEVDAQRDGPAAMELPFEPELIARLRTHDPLVVDGTALCRARHSPSPAASP